MDSAAPEFLREPQPVGTGDGQGCGLLWLPEWAVVIQYVDDILLCAETREECDQAAQALVSAVTGYPSLRPKSANKKSGTQVLNSSMDSMFYGKSG